MAATIATRCRGFTVLEVGIALLILSTVLISLTGSFLPKAQVSQPAKDTSPAALFLQSVMEDLAKQPYDALPSFNGNRILDQETQKRSRWSVSLSVFQAGVDLEQVDATLVDLHTARVLAHLSTLRSRR